jgi:hypothetical protein
MKTTVNLNDELLRRAKKLAAERGVTLTAFIEGALREALMPKPAGAYHFKWKSQRGKRRPSVDPADRDALYTLLDRS